MIGEHLPAFGSTAKLCPKCGQGRREVRYCTACDVIQQQDHLHLACTTCGYVLGVEAPLDVTCAAQKALAELAK